MSEREKLLESIAETMADYRISELPKATPEHVERWISQFGSEVQVPILREMNHVLERTYFSFQDVINFLKGVIKVEKLVGNDPCRFWQSAHFLDIQGGGNSQREMLALFDGLLQDACGLSISQCGEESDVFIYLDDVIFTGSRVRQDLELWLEHDAPNSGTLHIIAIAYHKSGQYYNRNRLKEKAKAIGKRIDIKWWRCIELEDRKSETTWSDVLRPTSIPDVLEVKEYVEAMTYKPLLRRPGSTGNNKLFSSEAGRHLLEQEFLKAGIKIRQMCPYLIHTQRPLGNMLLETLGFGSLIVTFRNCPNNAPLALWVGEPWYPLFRRTTNSQTQVKRMLEAFRRDQE